MQSLAYDHRFRNHGNLQTLPPTPPLTMDLDEPFIIETIDTADRLIMSRADMDKPRGPLAGNPSTGPVCVRGVAAGDVIAVCIESLSVVGHCAIGVSHASPAMLSPSSRWLRTEAATSASDEFA